MSKYRDIPKLKQGGNVIHYQVIIGGHPELSPAYLGEMISYAISPDATIPRTVLVIRLGQDESVKENHPTLF